jgi:hypothetical protein
MSRGGRLRAAAEYGGRIWTSTDHGVSWQGRGWASGGAIGDLPKDPNTTPYDMARQWCLLTAADDDSRLVAAEDGGLIWVSTDCGMHWAAGTGLAPREWRGLALRTTDGVRLAALALDGTLALSSNGGQSWTESAGPCVNAYALAAAAGATGSNDILAVAGSPGYVHISQDSGATWSARESLDKRDWRGLAMDDDGLVLYACADKEHCWKSLNGGVAWSKLESLGSGDWSDVACGPDGSCLMLGENAGALRVSYDYGGSWRRMAAVQQDNLSSSSDAVNGWTGVAMSGTGFYLMACAYGGGVWTYGCLSSTSSSSQGDACAWVERWQLGTHLWRAVAYSPRGDRCVAVGLGVGVWLGEFHGTRWKVWPAPLQPGLPPAYASQSGSPENPNMDYSSSSSSSSSLSSEQSRATKGWNCCAISADGSVALIGQDGGSLQITKTFGASWTVAAGIARWSSCSISENGNKMIAGTNGGRVWISQDKGTTWVEQTRLPRTRWLAVLMEGDGRRAFAASSIGMIYGLGLRDWFESSSSSSSSGSADDPVVTLAGLPPAKTNNRTAAVTVLSGPDIGRGLVTHYGYSVDGGEYEFEVPLAEPLLLANLSEGPHKLRVVGRYQYDLHGNTGGYEGIDHPLEHSWAVDTVPPQAVTLTGISLALANSSTANITVHAAADVVGYLWRLDDGPWVDDVVPIGAPLIQLTGLAEGRHVVHVKGVDAVGNWQAAPTVTDSAAWTVDTVPPAYVALTAPAALVTNSTVAAFTVSGAVDVVAYKWRLDAGAWGNEVAISSPVISLAGLAEGVHQLFALGRDAAGNWTAAEAASQQWTVDLTPPAATVAGYPVGPVNYASTNIAVGGAGVVSYQYKVNAAGTYTADIPVGTPLVATGLANGLNRIYVRGRDAAGNLQPAASATQTGEWTVDTTPPPAVTLTGGLTGLTTAKATVFTVAADADVAAYKWELFTNGTGHGLSQAIPIYLTDSIHILDTISEGEHYIRVIGYDLAGNPQPTPTISQTWTLDTTAPVAQLSGVPVGATSTRGATVTVGGSGVVKYKYELVYHV